MDSTRRDFLKTSLGATALLSLRASVPAFLSRAALAGSRREPGDTVLVVLQLSGGNDGLNTVVPFEDDTYARSRPTLRLSARRVLRIDSRLGFHPELTGFLRLHREGYLGVLQGVGYPGSSRNHGDALRDWHTARPGETACQTGWVGRTVDRVHGPGEASAPGVFVGAIDSPFGLNTESTVVPSVRSLQECTLRTPPGPGGGDAHRRRLLEAARLPRAGAGNSLLGFVQQNALAAHAGSRRVEALVGAGPPDRVEYPPCRLAGDLRTIARLIRARLGIRIYFTELGGGGFGGFDTHANQAGNHDALLRQLSESVAAFVEDLKREKLLGRVLLLTFSEFGRTVAENGRRGTDHGAAAPMFLAGGGLKGGMVGSHPSLEDLEGGAMKFHTDLRRVYATVLDRWLGFDSQAVLGERFEPLDVLEG